MEGYQEMGGGCCRHGFQECPVESPLCQEAVFASDRFRFRCAVILAGLDVVAAVCTLVVCARTAAA